RHWPKLVDWINRDRTFQLWLRRIKSNLELWSADPTDEEPLLRGGMLVQATEWLALRRDDLSPQERAHTAARPAPQETVRSRAQRVRAAIYGLLVGIIGSLLGVIFKEEIVDLWFEQTTLRRDIAADITPHVLTPEFERALRPGNDFSECAGD